MTTVTISIPESLRGFMQKQMKSKGFGNVSEYFRTLLRKAQEEEADAKLQALLLEGLNSGKDAELNREFWKDLKTEATQLLRKRQKSSAK
jgi:antitoxin ParD1/3/4